MMSRYETKPCGFISTVDGRPPGPLEQKRAPITGDIDFASLGVRNPVIQGRVCAYNKPHFYKGRIEAHRPGCFSASLTSGKTIRLFSMHKADTLCATTKDRLELVENEDGLYFRCALHPESDLQRELAVKVATGEYGEMSIGYTTQKERTVQLDGKNVRLLEECDLHEISVVTRGAVPNTKVALVDGSSRQSLRSEIRRGELFRMAISATAAKADIAFARFMAAMGVFGDKLSAWATRADAGN